MLTRVKTKTPRLTAHELACQYAEAAVLMRLRAQRHIIEGLMADIEVLRERA